MIDSSRDVRLEKLDRMLAEGQITQEHYEELVEELKDVEMLGGEGEDTGSAGPLASGFVPAGSEVAGESATARALPGETVSSSASAPTSASEPFTGSHRKAPPLLEVPIRVWIVALVSVIVGLAPLASHKLSPRSTAASAAVGLTLGFFLLRRARWAYGVAIAITLAEILRNLVYRQGAPFLINLAILAVLGSTVDWFLGTSFFAAPKETPPGR